jgi:aspartate carbamoyltransferase regulatory subunit
MLLYPLIKVCRTRRVAIILKYGGDKMENKYILNLENSSLNSSEWLTKNNHPKSFEIHNGVCISKWPYDKKYDIYLIINNKPLKRTSKLNCIFTNIKSKRKSVYKFNDLDIYDSRIDKVVRDIYEQTYAIKEVDNNKIIDLEYSIPLYMQDKKLNKTTIGEAYTYYITGVRYFSAKNEYEEYYEYKEEIDNGVQNLINIAMES